MSKARPEGPAQKPPHCPLPLLGEMWRHPGVRERRVVLDAGSAGQARVGFHQDCRNRVVMLGLDKALDAPRGRLDQIGALHRGGHAINVILLWDLINYLDDEFLAEMLARVYDEASPDLLCHTIVSSLGNKVSAQPTRFVPTETADAARIEDCESLMDAPRTTVAQLLVKLPGFAVEKGRMMDRGYSEYLLRWTGTNAPQKITPRGYEQAAASD